MYSCPFLQAYIHAHSYTLFERKRKDTGNESESVLLTCVQLFATPWTVAHQAPLSMEFFRREYLSGYPFPSPGNLPDPGIELGGKHLITKAVFYKNCSFIANGQWILFNFCSFYLLNQEKEDKYSLGLNELLVKCLPHCLV